MRIYFTGCSGSGKSTLAEHAGQRYGLKVLPSASRSVFATFGFPNFAELMANVPEYTRFQHAVLAKQDEMEYEAGDGFVSDRCVDNFAFASIYGTCGREIYGSQTGHRYLSRLQMWSRLTETFIFRVPPTRVVHAAALAQGVRSEYLQWDSMLRMDGAIAFILDVHGIKHAVVQSESLADRLAEIDAIVKPAS